MPKFDVPKLADYSGAIQANQSFQNAFRNLGQQSQDFLNYEEQKRKNQQDELLNTKKQEHEQTKYNNELQDKENTKIANRTTFQTLYPEEYKNFGTSFGGVPSVENANKMDSVLGSVDLNNFDKNRTYNYNANKDQKDFEYQQNRDKVEDNFKNQELDIRRTSANKPSELDRIMGILGLNAITNKNNAGTDTEANTQINGSASGNINVPIQKDNNITPQTLAPQVPIVQNSVVLPSNEQMSLSVGQANQKYGAEDYLTRGIEKTLEENGNTYSFNPITGTKMLIKKAPEKSILETQKLKNELNDEKISFESTIKNNDRLINQVDGLIKNKNLDYATGLLAPLSLIPATDAKGIAAEIEVIKGGAFLSGIEALKGTGALSDSEGKKVTDAIANLDRTQSPVQLRKQLGYIKDTLSIARENAIKKLKNRGVEYQDNQQQPNNKSWKDYQ